MLGQREMTLHLPLLAEMRREIPAPAPHYLVSTVRLMIVDTITNNDQDGLVLVLD